MPFLEHEGLTIASASGQQFSVLLEVLEYENRDLARALRRIGKLPQPSPEFQAHCLDLWLSHGETLRDMVNDDFALAEGLRVLLPSYTGPALTLFRGDSARCRQTRRYGLAWTDKLDVARDYAVLNQKERLYGGVVLETFAAPDAIICAPGLLDDRFDEGEVLVDRRRLDVVKVLERLAPTDAARNARAERDERRLALRSDPDLSQLAAIVADKSKR